MSAVKWGLVSTIRAPLQDCLEFAAHHLDIGAHRLFIYLDEDVPDTLAVLNSHARIKARCCDATHWMHLGGKRPIKHQVRQTRNATHAYRRAAELDWLGHIDVDEFLWPAVPLADQLAALPAHNRSARVRPIEGLAGRGPAFKAYLPSAGPVRQRTVARLYPRFGASLKGGFLSHVAGKMFARTGQANITMRIHNIEQDGEKDTAAAELTQTDLCHCHVTGWDHWRAVLENRRTVGSYRADMRPSQSDAETIHDLLHRLEREEGEAGLRAFYDEVVADTPEMRKKLERSGQLRLCPLNLSEKVQRHFPGL